MRDVSVIKYIFCWNLLASATFVYFFCWNLLASATFVYQR